MEETTKTWLTRASAALNSALGELRLHKAIGSEPKPQTVKSIVAEAFRKQGFDRMHMEHPDMVESSITGRVKFEKMKTVEQAIQLLAPMLSSINFALDQPVRC